MQASPLATAGALAIGPSGRGLFIKTRKWRDRWGVPGGKIAYGEMMVGALRREFLEETGLSLERVFWGPVQEAVESPEFYKPAHFILLNFIAHCSSEMVRLNEEAQAYSWLLPERALSYPLNTPTRVLVAFYLEHQHQLREV